MKKSLIAAAVFALGIAGVANADWRDSRRDSYRYDRHDHRDDRRYDRHDDRHRHHDHYDNFDREVSLRDVPRNVVESLRCETRGGKVEGVQFVRRNGNLFYRFQVHEGRDHHHSIRISPGGKVMSVQEVEDGRYLAGR